MTQAERMKLAAKLYSCLYPKGNFFKLDSESAEKYAAGATDFIDYVIMKYAINDDNQLNMLGD